MSESLLIRLWAARFQFIKYFITGIIAVVLDIASLYALKEYLHLRPVTAVVINQIFILNYVFFTNKYWSFKAQGTTGKQAIRFLIVAGWNYLFAIFWMWLWTEKSNFELPYFYLLARTANIALAVAWNFLLYRYWVYREWRNGAAVNNQPSSPVV